MNAAHVVAVTELEGSPELAASRVAAALGTTPYELRLALSAGLPAIVLMTSDAARARAAQEKIRSEGHRVVACTRADVVRSTSMTALKDFRFDEQELLASGDGADR